MVKTLITTVIGSHMWGMNRSDSDIDLFTVFQVPSKTILVGDSYKKSKFIQKDGEDIHMHEVGKVIEMLIKNNVNFVWGVTSPLFVEGDERIYKELGEIARSLLSKQIYKPVRGLAVHNYKKYIESEKDVSEKRCNIIARTIVFGIAALNGKIKYITTEGANPDTINVLLSELDAAYENSKLPERPDEDAVRKAKEWLLDLRLQYL